jgi:hypothetical protein
MQDFIEAKKEIEEQHETSNRHEDSIFMSSQHHGQGGSP